MKTIHIRSFIYPTMQVNDMTMVFFFKVLMIDLCVEANGTWIPLFFDRCFFHWKVYEERSKDCDRTWKWNFQRWGRLTASHSGDISTHLNSIFYVVSLTSFIRILNIRFWPFKLEINSMWFWLFLHFLFSQTSFKKISFNVWEEFFSSSRRFLLRFKKISFKVWEDFFWEDFF